MSIFLDKNYEYIRKIINCIKVSLNVKTLYKKSYSDKLLIIINYKNIKNMRYIKNL